VSVVYLLLPVGCIKIRSWDGSKNHDSVLVREIQMNKLEKELVCVFRRKERREDCEVRSKK